MSNRRPVLSIIIPARNEEKNLPWVLTRIKRMAARLPQHEILVVDGHSKDRTRAVARSFCCRVVSDHNKGKGEALRTGAKRAKGRILLFIDADGSHDPRDIPKLIRPILKKDIDHVSGSRMLAGSDDLFKDFDQFIRLTGSVLITLGINYRFKARLTDCQNGFRAIKKEVFGKLNLKENVTTIEQEMVIKTLRHGFSLAEVPAHEYERRFGKSSIVVWRKAPRYVFSWLKYLFFD